MEFEDLGGAGEGGGMGEENMERRDVQYGAAEIGTGLDGRLLRKLVCLPHSRKRGIGSPKKFCVFHGSLNVRCLTAFPVRNAFGAAGKISLFGFKYDNDVLARYCVQAAR